MELSQGPYITTVKVRDSAYRGQLWVGGELTHETTYYPFEDKARRVIRKIAKATYGLEVE